ncbi:MAG: hypothetical protein ACRDE2_12400 [Chitinophagaceae bacterium]
MNWIAIGSTGTFLTFVVTLITIFKKDKHVPKQIDQLAGIVEILKTQDETMRTQNDLVAQQVDIFRNSSILKGNDGSALIELRDIEKRKLRLSVRPDFRVAMSYQGFSGQMQVRLYNTGEIANIKRIDISSEDVDLHPFQTPATIEKGQQREISGTQKGKKHIKDCEYEIKLIYADKLNFEYSADIKGAGGKAIITSINEIEK